MSKINFEVIYEAPESTDEMKLLMKFFLCFTWQFLWTLKFTLSSSHENLSASGVISDNCLSLAFRKCRKDSNIILKVFLVQGFCPLIKNWNCRFLIGFRLNESRRMRGTMSATCSYSPLVFLFMYLLFPLLFLRLG